MSDDIARLRDVRALVAGGYPPQLLRGPALGESTSEFAFVGNGLRGVRVERRATLGDASKGVGMSASLLTGGEPGSVDHSGSLFHHVASAYGETLIHDLAAKCSPNAKSKLVRSHDRLRLLRMDRVEIEDAIAIPNAF
jgi:hypothetical protein